MLEGWRELEVLGGSIARGPDEKESRAIVDRMAEYAVCVELDMDDHEDAEDLDEVADRIYYDYEEHEELEKSEHGSARLKHFDRRVRHWLKKEFAK
tara:strand:+ start:230 stop:517 length:288 start_codon:yes stop_codon:yes gene_type:complete